MAWFRLDDAGAFHAKVLDAGNEAYGAWCRAGQWSSCHGTEGLVPRSTALTIAKLAVWKRLIAAKGSSEFGLVLAEGDNFRIHDFLVYNPTAQEVEAKRSARSEAGRRGGLRSAEVRRPRVEPSSSELKTRAHYDVTLAIKAGRLIRQPCEVCGVTTNVEAHHDDYSRPLSVRWLCKRHHAEHHQGSSAQAVATAVPQAPAEAPAQAIASAIVNGSPTPIPIPIPIPIPEIQTPGVPKANEAKPDAPPAVDHPLPQGFVALERNEWIRRYSEAIDLVAPGFTFDPKKFEALRRVVEKRAPDRSVVPDWLGREAERFARAAQAKAAMWSGYSADGFERWWNSGCPVEGDVGARYTAPEHRPAIHKAVDPSSILRTEAQVREGRPREAPAVLGRRAPTVPPKRANGAPGTPVEAPLVATGGSGIATAEDAGERP